jgi:hypothetical protein
MSPNKELNELKTSVTEISNKLSGVDIKELKASMDEISMKWMISPEESVTWNKD